MTTPGNLRNLLTRLWHHLSRRRQRQFGFLLVLMLVSAFAGFDHMHALYRHAIAHHYRFFSYGDAMLLEKNSQRKTDHVEV